MKPEEFIPTLKAALNEYRYTDVQHLTQQIDPRAFGDDQARMILSLLRRKRRFAEMKQTADSFIHSGLQAPVIRRQRAQSLLDQNFIHEALQDLKDLVNEVADDPHEGPETRGLIGRAYKQLYVNEGGSDNLKQALVAYLPDWQEQRGDYRWHGINVAALLARADQDGMATGINLNVQEIARTILNDIEMKGATGVWDYGTAMEASMAIGDWDTALEWTGKYVKHPDTDAFEIASTLRQMKEVWCLDDTPEGGKLLPVLEYALLQCEGATLEPTGSQILDPSGFQAVYGAEGLIHLQWFDTLQKRCLAIARMSDSASGASYGTGFLVQGSSLRADWGDAPVFVTNSHVLSVNPSDQAPLDPNTAEAEFTRLPGRPKAALGELLFTSPRTQLDVTILRMEHPPEGATPLQPSPYNPALAQVGGKPQRIYIIGHPKGGELAASIYNNDLTGYDPPYVHYRSPTEGGSSGSPVFNRQWDLFAVHHRALITEQVNEGVLLGPIAEAVKTAPSASKD